MARAAYPERHVQLWIQDEGRFGLKPILKRTWALKGQRPVIPQRRRYQWLYAYVFVQPRTGASEFLLLPSVNVASMNVALASFSQAVDPLHRAIIVLVLDRAGWHMSKDVRVPSNIVLVPLPPYTPELSPAEPMMNKLKQPLANKCLSSLEELEAVLSKECVRLQANPAEVRSLTSFPWVRHVLDSS